MNAAAMTGYGRMCGWTLARAHARTGDRIAIAAYLGGSDKFDHAVADFAESYADQTERDHTALADAVASGRVRPRWASEPIRPCQVPDQGTCPCPAELGTRGGRTAPSCRRPPAAQARPRRGVATTLVAAAHRGGHLGLPHLADAAMPPVSRSARTYSASTRARAR